MSQGQPVSLGFPFLLVLKEKLYGSIAQSFLDQIFFLTPNQQCQSTDIDQWPFLILSLSSIGLQVEETLFDLRWPTVVMVWIILWVVSVCDAGILCLND